MSRYTLASLLLVLATPLAAQRVPVTLVASLAGHDGKIIPVSGRFWFVTLDGRDSVAANTDGTGSARIELLPGEYRVRSFQRAMLGGRAYYWDLPVSVSAPTQVELSSANAQESAPSGEVIVMDAPAPPQDAGSRRRGFWCGFVPGYASVDCNECGGWESAGGFTLHLGGTVSPYLRIGVSSDTLVREREGVGYSQTNFTTVLMFFPSRTYGLRFTGGVGFAGRGRFEADHHYEYTDADGEGGVGYVLGVAYEAMVAKKFALAPYVSYLGGSFDRGHSYFWLFGLAATWP